MSALTNAILFLLSASLDVVGAEVGRVAGTLGAEQSTSVCSCILHSFSQARCSTSLSEQPQSMQCELSKLKRNGSWQPRLVKNSDHLHSYVAIGASLFTQEAREIAELAEFASPQVPRGVSLLAEASPAASLTDNAASGATRGSIALAALLPNAELRSPEFRSPVRSVSAALDPSFPGAARSAVFSGSRASTRTPALLRRETAVTTARGVYFSQVRSRRQC